MLPETDFELVNKCYAFPTQVSELLQFPISDISVAILISYCEVEP